MLRLAGVTGADPDGIPWVNRLVDAVAADVGLGHGVALPVFARAWPPRAIDDVTLLAQKAAAGSVRFDRTDGQGGRPRPGGPPAARSAPASGRSTGAGPSATGWSSGTATRSSGRGST